MLLNYEMTTPFLETHWPTPVDPYWTGIRRGRRIRPSEGTVTCPICPALAEVLGLGFVNRWFNHQYGRMSWDSYGILWYFGFGPTFGHFRPPWKFQHESFFFCLMGLKDRILSLWDNVFDRHSPRNKEMCTLTSCVSRRKGMEGEWILWWACCFGKQLFGG